MSNEIKRPKNNELELSTDVIDLTKEMAPAKPRFVIFGSRTSGAYGTATAFEEYLTDHGFEDAQVDAVRNAAFINDAFFNTPPEDMSREFTESKRPGVLRKLGLTLLRREVVAQEEDSKDLPQGVVVFPEMRQYMPSGSGMSIPSPREYIQDLCDKNSVPVIFMEDMHGNAELNAAFSIFELETAQVTE